MLKELKNVYEGRKIFLTGHTGFKGAWLLKILTMVGAEVKGYALQPDHPDCIFNLINGDKICQSVISDIRDRKSLSESILDFQPDFVFHLAAQPLVRQSYEAPLETFEINAIGTANLLDAVRGLKRKCSLVIITTDKVYHNREWEYPYREVDTLGGYDPYSASKACAELVINSFRNSYFPMNKYETHKKGIAVGRAGNVIGGGDWSKDRLIPDVVLALERNEEIVIRNPDAVRPWQHVLEPLFAYLLLGHRLDADPVQYSQSYNFGPHTTDALPVRKMVEYSIDSWGSGSFRVVSDPNQRHEAGLLKLDISKAISELSWKPKMSAQEAVQQTINWYKKFYQNQSEILEYIEYQITRFSERCYHS